MTEAKNKQILTRAECAAMRGIAIIGICLHNYCHWLGFAVKENEYTFDMAKSHGIVEAMMHPDAYLPIHLLSFFGHYGVPVFLFLSAYGLVMKYEGQGRGAGKDVSAASFIKKHFLKLFSMMIAGFALFLMVDAITPGAHHYKALDVVAQLLMLNNIMPDPDHVIWPGPYWFFGLMLQLYAVYRLFLYRRGWKAVAIAVALCWAAQAFCDPAGETLNRVRYNFMGGMLPFGAGLLLVKYGRNLTHSAWIIITVVSATATMFFSLNFQLWLWNPLAVCFLCVGIVKTIPQRANKALAWVGGISAALFVMHPVTRKVFINLYRHDDVYAGLALYVVASVAIAWFYHEMRKRWKSQGQKPKQAL